MLLTYKNEIIRLYSGGCRNTCFEIKRSGGNDEQNKENKEKRVFLRLQVLRFITSTHTVTASIVLPKSIYM